MKKKFSFLLFVLIAALTLSACGNNFKTPDSVGNESAAVENNGAMAVKKGDYLYFVNGVQTYTEDNTYGTPQLGAIMRTKLTADGTPEVVYDSKDRLDESKMPAETVVPKIFYNAYTRHGIYIFDNRIYYTTPSLKKDTDGNVWTSYLDVFSCSLTGTDIKEIATITSNSFALKFWQDSTSKTVYLVYYNTTAKTVVSINASASKPSSTTLAEDISTAILGEDGNVYYTQRVLKDGEFTGTDTYEAFNRFFKVPFVGGEAQEILDVNGKELTLYYNYSSKTYNEKKDLTVTPVAVTADGTIYFTRNDKIGASTSTVYYCLKEGQLYMITSLATLSNVTPLTLDNTEALLCTYTSATNTSTIKTMTFKRQSKSVFASDYKPTEVEGLTNTVMNHSAAPTYLFVRDGKLYYLADSRVAVVDVDYNIVTNPVFETEYLTENAVNTSFLRPTVIGDVVFFFSTVEDYSYTGYCTFTTTDEDGELKDVRFGKLTDADAKSYKEKLEDEDEEENS